MLSTVASFDRIGEENAFAVLARATALARAGRDVINLGIGQPDFATPENVVEAAVKALRDGHHGYTPATGILPLREGVAADLHRRFGVEVSPENVVVVPGGKVTMFAAILLFGEPGAEIVYPDPGFPIYRSMIEFTGATPVPLPVREENGFAFSAEEALSLLNGRTRLVILNSPANPTGGVTPKSEVDALVAGLERFPGVAVLSDEIYGQMTYDGLRPHEPALLPVDPRPADHARRLVQDLRHDGLAHGLRRVAGRAGRQGAQARRQLLVLRQRPRAMGRARGPGGPAGRRPRHGGGVRPAPRHRGRGAERPAGRAGRDAEAAPSTPSPTSRARAGARSRSPRPCWRRPASPRSAARTSASTARATSA